MTPDPSIGTILCIIVLTVLSAWLGAMLQALRTANESRIRHEAEEGDTAARKALAVLEREDHCIWAVQTAVLICYLLAGCVDGTALLPWCAARLTAAGMGEAPASALGAVIVLLAGAAIMLLFYLFAMRLCVHLSNASLYRLISGAHAVEVLFRPLNAVLRGISGGLLRMGGVDPNKEAEEVTEEEILAMVDIGGESGAIEEDEAEMIENVMAFNDRTAYDIMTHRTDMECIQAGETQENILQIIRESGLSRFPVYNGDVDDIIGILNTRDYLLELQQPHPRSLHELLREAY